MMRSLLEPHLAIEGSPSSGMFDHSSRGAGALAPAMAGAGSLGGAIGCEGRRLTPTDGRQRAGPHFDATFPSATAELREVIAPLSAESHPRILGENARRLYRI